MRSRLGNRDERHVELAWRLASEIVRATACRNGDDASVAVSRAADQPPDTERAILMIGAFVIPLLIKGQLGSQQPSRDLLQSRAHSLAVAARSVVDLQEPELLYVLRTAYGDHEQGAPMSLARFVVVGLLVLGILFDDPIAELERVRASAFDYAIGELRRPSVEWSKRG